MPTVADFSGASQVGLQGTALGKGYQKVYIILKYSKLQIVQIKIL